MFCDPETQMAQNSMVYRTDDYEKAERKNNRQYYSFGEVFAALCDSDDEGDNEALYAESETMVQRKRKRYHWGGNWRGGKVARILYGKFFDFQCQQHGSMACRQLCVDTLNSYHDMLDVMWRH